MALQVAIESIPTSNFASFDDFPTPAPSGGSDAGSLLCHASVWQRNARNRGGGDAYFVAGYIVSPPNSISITERDFTHS